MEVRLKVETRNYMALAQIYEGTLEEIVARYGSELRGQQLRVTTIPKLPSQEPPFYETATPEEWTIALRAWAGVGVVAGETRVTKDTGWVVSGHMSGFNLWYNLALLGGDASYGVVYQCANFKLEAENRYLA